MAALASAVSAAQKVTNADELAMLKDSIAKVNAVEQALNAPMPDQQDVLGAFKQVGATCLACHKQYREQDENQQYRLKAGAI